MDIFRVLVEYNMGTIQEVVVSSFLHYLLNPKEDHGLGAHFAEQFFLSCGLAPEALNSVEKWRETHPPTIHVIPEWDGGEDPESSESCEGSESCEMLENPESLENADNRNKKKQPLGRIDALIILVKNRKAWIYGIEVKIHAQSARNESKAGSQLARYAKALDKFRKQDRSLQELLSDESIILPDSVSVGGLIYVVPGVDKTWPSFVQRGLMQSGNILSEMLKIVTWRKIAGGFPHEIEKYSCPKTVEDVLTRILLESQIGKIPPPDQSTLHMLRCLRYALRSNFTYENKLHGKFPNSEQFRNALESKGQLVVLKWIQDAVQSWIDKKPLFAQRTHTCIGVPFKRRPEQGSNNTLCRIQTVESYLEPDKPRDGIYIELSERNGWTKKDEVLEMLRKHPELDSGPIGLTFALLEGIYYHQNGKDNEIVYVVSICAETSKNVQSDVAKKQLKVFFDALHDKFKTTYGRTGE